jgi:hypothetical protein
MPKRRNSTWHCRAVHDNAEPYISVQAEQYMAVKNSACQCRPTHHGAQKGYIVVHAGKCVGIWKLQRLASSLDATRHILMTSVFFTAQLEVAFRYIFTIFLFWTPSKKTFLSNRPHPFYIEENVCTIGSPFLESHKGPNDSELPVPARSQRLVRQAAVMPCSLTSIRGQSDLPP